MKKLLISVAILMFATLLFVHDEENKDNDPVKEEFVLTSSESKSDS